MFGDEPIIEPQADEPIIEQEQSDEPKPLEYNEPEVEDTYNKEQDNADLEAFMKTLDEKYPIKGRVEVKDIDKKDPNAINKFFNDVQDNARTDIENKSLREQALNDFKAQQESKHWASAYKAYPNLREDKDTRDVVNIFAKGAGCSPLKAANFVNKFVTQVYNQGFNAARSITKQVPSRPLGNQQQATPVRVNQKAMAEKLAGDEDDIAAAVAAAQKLGIGGL